MDNYTKLAVFVGVTTVNDERSSPTTPSVYVLTKDFIIWKYNEKQFHVNLPCIVFLLCAVIIGIIGNTSVLYVFYSKLKRNNTVILTSWLSASDLIGSFLLLFEIYDKRLPMYSGQNIVLCKAMRFFDIFMNSVSAFLLLCIAFDRYFKVCKPLKRMSRQKLKIAIISAFVVPAVCVWPMAIFHGPEKRATKFEGIYGMDCADDDQYSGTFIKKAFFLFVMLTILCSIVILVVLYSFIFHAILRWKREAIGESIIVRTDSKQNRKWNQSKSSLDVVHTNSIDTRELGERKSDQFLRSEKVIDIEVRSPNTSCNKRNNNMELKDVAENNQIFEKHKVRILVKSHRIQDSNHSKTSVFGRDDSNINGNNHNGHSASLKNKVTMKCDQNNKSVLQRVGSNTSKRRNTNRSTVMFSVVSLLYILSFLPTVVMEAANAFGAVYEANLSVTVKQLVVVANVSYFLNGSLNPIVYFVFNKSYRDEIYKMIMFR